MKNFVLILVAILLVGGAFIFAENRNNQAKNIYSAQELSVSNTIDPNAQNIDSDGDGSKDWEEVLAGTDPHDPKSKPSLDQSKTTKDLTTKAPEKLEPIDLLSRDFFARYMELRQSGTSADKANQQELVNTTISKIQLAQAKPYTSSEIKVGSDTSKNAVKKYSNDIGAIFSKYVLLNTQNEGVIAKDALGAQDPEILKQLDPIIQSDKNIVNGILKVQAPQSMATMHLDLLNAMNNVLFVAQSFKKVFIDPISGIQASSQYLTSRETLINAIRAIQSYNTYLGITYDSSEPGKMFAAPK